MILITGGSGSGKSAYGEKMDPGSWRYDPVLYCYHGSIWGRRQKKGWSGIKDFAREKGFITIESPKR